VRGYFGIGIVAGKSPENIGGLWRSAHAFGASFIFTVGHRYPKQPTDTTKAWRHVPLYEYPTLEAFTGSLPRDCDVIGVECPGHRSLASFRHPERAVYLLGAEDVGLRDAVEVCRSLVEIPTKNCLNVATAGSLVMYDRVVRA
jgi:tRNA G18 (ribose-2'-O)-methylase SpoU